MASNKFRTVEAENYFFSRIQLETSEQRTREHRHFSQGKAVAKQSIIATLFQRSKVAGVPLQLTFAQCRSPTSNTRTRTEQSQKPESGQQAIHPRHPRLPIDPLGSKEATPCITWSSSLRFRHWTKSTPTSSKRRRARPHSPRRN